MPRFWRRLPLALSASSRATTLAMQGLALLLLAAARTPSARLELHWSAPDGCPSAEQVRNDVDGLLANQPVNGSEPVVATASIQPRSDAGYSLMLTANGQTRTIDGENCQQLAQAAALLLALLVDPSRATSLSEPPGAAGGGNQPQPQPPATPVDAHHASAQPAAPASTATPKTKNQDAVPPRPTDTSILLEAGLRLDVGSWPTPEPAVMLGVGFATSALQGLVHGSVGKSVHLSSAADGGLDLFVAAFDVTGAYRVRLGRWGFEPGVGVDLGVTRASSHNFEPDSRVALSLSLIGALRASWQPSTALRLWGEVGAGVPVVRPRWVLDDGEQLHRFGPFLRTQIGAQVAF